MKKNIIISIIVAVVAIIAIIVVVILLNNGNNKTPQTTYPNIPIPKTTPPPATAMVLGRFRSPMC